MFLFAKSPPRTTPGGVDEAVIHEIGWLAVGGPQTALAVVGHLTVAFLGQLHYVDELRGGLRQAAAQGRARTAADDAALLADAWLRWGARALDELEGTFSGVVLDRDKGTSVVFRDITAGRAAYLTSHAGAAVAGSSLEAVSTWEGRRRQPSELFVASYVQNQWLDPRCTPYDGVESLEAGSVARPQGASWAQTRQSSWRPRTHGRMFADGYVDLVAETLDGAMRERLRGVTKAGVALSGGLDSTNVLAAGVRVAPHIDWTAYCIPFYTSAGDERHRQTAVAEHLGVRQSWVSVEGMGPLGSHDPEAVTTPHWAGNWYLMRSIAKVASADGTEVVFDGEDADSLFTGSPVYLADLLLRGRWATLRRQINALAAMGELPRRTGVNTALLLPLPPSLTRRLVDLPANALVSPLVAAPLAARHDLAARLEQSFTFRWAPGNLFRASQEMGCTPAHLDFVAVESERNVRGTSVRDGHPFTDRRVIELALGLPWNAVTPARPDKHLLKELAARRLPVERAGPFSKAVLDEYFEAAGRTFEREQILTGLRLAAQMPEVFAPDQLARVQQDLLDGGSSWDASRAAGLALWLRSF